MMVDATLEREAIHFLHREADLLDRRSFSQWLEMISPDISYKIPVRTQRLNGEGDGFSKTAFFMREDLLSLKVRVAKLASPSAWAENPATRTRHMVSNVRVGEADAAGLPVTSNFATFCYRGEATMPVILSGERQDVLVEANGDWKLRKRLVLLDSTVLGLEALSIFL
jgi:3-phenylpropionate/cinnamic acid dioxygenase small subunit